MMNVTIASLEERELFFGEISKPPCVDSDTNLCVGACVHTYVHTCTHSNVHMLNVTLASDLSEQ